MLDSSAETVFDAITAAAISLCGTPIALISLIDEHRQWFKSRIGMEQPQTARCIAFCAHVVQSGEMLEVPDVLEDARFFDNPMVTYEPHIRFYAGAPLITSDGFTMGTLCVIDREPRVLDDTQRKTLVHLGAAIMALMENHKANAHQVLLGRIIDASQSIILLIDAHDGHLVHANPAARAALGHAPGAPEISGSAILRAANGLSFDDSVEQLRGVGPVGREIDTTLERISGGSLPVEGRLQLWRHAQNELCVLIVQDVSRRRQVETALRDSEARVRAIADNLPAMIAEVGRDLRYRFCNAGYAHVFGGDPARMIGRHLSQIGDPKVLDMIRERVEGVLAGTPQTFEGAMKIGRRDYLFESRFIPRRDETGEIDGFFAMTVDIADRKRLEQVLRSMATHDALTGLPNRTQLREHFSAAIARSLRQKKVCALYFLDIDKFKQVNDRYGHATGDRVLRVIAERLRSSIRESDLAARLAGDEFVVVTENLTTLEEAGRIGDAILRAMSRPIEIETGDLQVGISIGIAIWPRDGEGLDDLLHQADLALYCAKQAGRGTWRMVTALPMSDC